MTPKRGAVYWIDLGHAMGSEIEGLRPAVVVQNDVGNRYSNTTIVAAITSRFAGKDYPVIVRLPDGVLPESSAVNTAQVRTVDVSRLRGHAVAQLDDATMREVDDALRVSLGLW